ncbi:response regulator receiver domain [Joostella sp. CR20]|uniref:response regulator receiver domain n=1 Tax=Joostella sp. CR20 TaxID=2804312 RepID=UPI00313C9ABB
MYNQKAFEILSSSISSAVFIDEKAKDFFSETPVDSQIPEEQLSVDLFNTFRDNGKSLMVHKFQKENLDNPKTIEYLFSGKDLILLDWELDKVTGQEYSLQLLSKSIELPYINFCCIYSRSTNFSEIPLFLTAYFSGLTKGDFNTLKNTYEYLTIEEVQGRWNNSENDIDNFFNENEIDIQNLPIEGLADKSKKDILKYIYIALNSEKYIILENDVNNHEIIHFDKDSFIINNTFVLVLKKEEETDKYYEKLIRRISDAIVKNKSSFFQLLGLEMQTVFNSNERFIDETILKSSTEALFSFRNYINDDKIFGTIIKKLLLEQATLNLRTAKLKLLESDFLEEYGETLINDINTDDLMRLNTFYNAVSVKSLNEEDIPNLNFGDVFKGTNNDYYLCVTALCDCYYPDKIENNYYFVKGKEFNDTELAILLGDTAFISYLPNGKAVFWGQPENPSLKKIKQRNKIVDEENVNLLKQRLNELGKDIEGLSKNISKLNKFLYKPYYIKPKTYYVESNKMTDDKIKIWVFTNKNGDTDFNDIEIKYITTLRNDYAQRIANHAFGHPARVGVDFVKLKP